MSAARAWCRLSLVLSLLSFLLSAFLIFNDPSEAGGGIIWQLPEGYISASGIYLFFICLLNFHLLNRKGGV